MCNLMAPLSGNLNLHEIVFHDRVRSVYGPVMSWEDQLNPDDVDDLGDGRRPDDLRSVYRSARRTTSRPPEPPRITIRSNSKRLAMRRSKESNTGHCPSNDVHRRQRPVDARRRRPPRCLAFSPRAARRSQANTAAKHIFYWRSENRIAVNAFRYLDLNQVPGEAPSKTKPGATKPAKKADKK